METMFRIYFERLLGFVSLLILTGLIVGWSIDLQRKAASQMKGGLISLTAINKELMKRDKRAKPQREKPKKGQPATPIYKGASFSKVTPVYAKVPF